MIENGWLDLKIGPTVSCQQEMHSTGKDPQQYIYTAWKQKDEQRYSK